METRYNVVEIFDSIEGEGKRSGTLASFVRFAGCNLRCNYCDTTYALFGEEEPCRYESMTKAEVLERMVRKQVTLTGGEPLLQRDISVLIRELITSGHEVNIETNGAVDIRPYRMEEQTEQLFFTIDYKLPSSGMEHKMFKENFQSLRSYDVVKFVIGSSDDETKTLEIAKWLKDYYDKKNCPQIFIGSVSGKWSNENIVEMMKRNPILEESHLQVQLHKVVWDVNRRGV